MVTRVRACSNGLGRHKRAAVLLQPARHTAYHRFRTGCVCNTSRKSVLCDDELACAVSGIPIQFFHHSSVYDYAATQESTQDIPCQNLTLTIPAQF